LHEGQAGGYQAGRHDGLPVVFTLTGAIASALLLRWLQRLCGSSFAHSAQRFARLYFWPGHFGH
jgi:hypothetical protein